MSIWNLVLQPLTSYINNNVAGVARALGGQRAHRVPLPEENACLLGHRSDVKATGGYSVHLGSGDNTL